MACSQAPRPISCRIAHCVRTLVLASGLSGAGKSPPCKIPVPRSVSLNTNVHFRLSKHRLLYRADRDCVFNVSHTASWSRFDRVKQNCPQQASSRVKIMPVRVQRVRQTSNPFLVVVVACRRVARDTGNADNVARFSRRRILDQGVKRQCHKNIRELAGPVSPPLSGARKMSGVEWCSMDGHIVTGDAKASHRVVQRRCPLLHYHRWEQQ